MGEAFETDTGALHCLVCVPVPMFHVLEALP